MMPEPVKTVFWTGLIAILLCVAASLLSGCATNCPRGHITCNFN